jgi:hypothetical protein
MDSRSAVLRPGCRAGLRHDIPREGATRDGYRPSRHPVSSLALGARGRVQAANFAVTGTLVLAGAVGLGRAADPALSGRAGRAQIGAAGAGLIGAAIFATDR